MTDTFIDLALWVSGSVAMIGIIAWCVRNITASGDNGAWPFGGDW